MYRTVPLALTPAPPHLSPPPDSITFRFEVPAGFRFCPPCRHYTLCHEALCHTSSPACQYAITDFVHHHILHNRYAMNMMEFNSSLAINDFYPVHHDFSSGPYVITILLRPDFVTRTLFNPTPLFFLCHRIIVRRTSAANIYDLGLPNSLATALLQLPIQKRTLKQSTYITFAEQYHEIDDPPLYYIELPLTQPLNITHFRRNPIEYLQPVSPD